MTMTKVPNDTLAARLILMRHELGWSQRKASDETGVSFGIWQGMESGREARGLDRLVTAIAAATGYDRDWLMWGGMLRTSENPRPADSPDGGSDTSVRREGIEPPTRCLRATTVPVEHLAEVIPMRRTRPYAVSHDLPLAQ